MTRTGRTGGGRADCGGRADGRTGGGRADRGRRAADGRRTKADNGWTGGQADGAVDGRTGGQVGGLADWRTGGRRISEGKTPNLTHPLTWPWEIQRGRPRVTVKLPHLPPPSQ